MLKFHAPTPLNQISERASKQKSLVAVPYLGKDAAELLLIPAGSILVTKFTIAAVKGGQVSPSEVIKFLKRGVRVHSYRDLHAKVYVFGKRVFIGSANVSSSAKKLAEACVEVTDPKIIKEAKAFIESMTGDLVTLEQAKKMLALYPKDGERMFGVKSFSTLIRNRLSHPPVWICPVVYEKCSIEEEGELKRGRATAKKKISNSEERSLGEYIARGKLKFSEGDWLVFRFINGGGFRFESPEKVIHINSGRDLNKHYIYLERLKRARDITSSVVREKLGKKSVAMIYKSYGIRKIHSEETGIKFLKLWRQHQGTL